MQLRFYIIHEVSVAAHPPSQKRGKKGVAFHWLTKLIGDVLSSLQILTFKAGILGKKIFLTLNQISFSLDSNHNETISTGRKSTAELNYGHKFQLPQNPK